MIVTIKSKKNFIIVSCILLIFVIYLIEINNILLIGRPHLYKVSNDDNLTHCTVFSSIDNCYPLNNILEEIFVEGWAFSDTDKPYTNRKMGVLLTKDSGEKYLVTTENIYDREDVYNYYQANGRMLSGYKHGFSLHFSTIQLPDGKYNMGIYCFENMNSYGANILSNKILEKKGKNVWISKWTSEEYILSESKVDDLAVYNLDSIDKNKDGSVSVTGWAYIPQQDSKLQKTYLLFVYSDGSNAIYNTLPINRVDVANAFSNELYIQSGFQAELSPDLLHSENFDIYVLVQDEYGLHTLPVVLDIIRSELRLP